MSINPAGYCLDAGLIGLGVIYDRGAGLFLWWLGEEEELPLYHHDELCLPGTDKCTVGGLWL